MNPDLIRDLTNPATKATVTLQAKAIREQRRRKRSRNETVEIVGAAETAFDYTRYADDPVGFGEEVFGEKYTEDAKRVMRSVQEFPITIAKSANAVGKTHGAARVAVWFYKAKKKPDNFVQVYTTATPEGNLKRLLWGEIGGLTARHPRVFSDDRVLTLDIISQSDPQSFITGVAIPLAGSSAQREGKFSGKHAPFLLFIVDEGDTVPDEVYKGIESCLSGGFGRLLIMFNPRAKEGPVWKMVKERGANVVNLSAFDHPNVTTGRDIIPGAVSREKTIRRLNLWTEPLDPAESPNHECFKVPDFLVGQTTQSNSGEYFPPLPAGYRKIIVPEFYYMVLGEYPAQSELSLISESWIDEAVMRWKTYVAVNGERPHDMIKPVAGLDVAEYGVDRNILRLRYGGFVPRLNSQFTWGDVDPDTTAIKSAELCRLYNVRVCNVDATGVGAAVPARMQRLGVMAEGVKVAWSPTEESELGLFSMLRDQLWWAVREWLRIDKGAMLPPSDKLKEELLVAKYIKINGRIKVTDKATMRELLGRSPDEADSLCLTFYNSQTGAFSSEYV